MNRPLLVVDGDSFAHRSYHALPKSIRRAGNQGGGAIVGFANFLLRLYESERSRAVLVGWDTLGSPTYRQKLFPGYQGGREFDQELVEQLDAVPEFIAACGVGPKGAAALLRKLRIIEDAFADGQLSSLDEALRLYRHIATMDPTSPLSALDDHTPTWDKAAALARACELNSLAARLDELA